VKEVRERARSFGAVRVGTMVKFTRISHPLLGAPSWCGSSAVQQCIDGRPDASEKEVVPMLACQARLPATQAAVCMKSLFCLRVRQ
jgi:hypothetical protein